MKEETAYILMGAALVLGWWYGSNHPNVAVAKATIVAAGGTVTLPNGQ